MAHRPWYQEYFGQRYLDSYNPIITPERTLHDVDFIEPTIAIPKGGKILDLCCGHGRHLIELASRGYEMTGLDLDAFFLDLAQEEAHRRGLQVRLEHRDMRDIPFVEEFDGVINVFTSFGYFESDEEDQKVLNGVAKALKPGGRFFIEVVNRDGLIRWYSPRNWYETENGVRVLDEREFDHLAGRNNNRQISIYPDGTQREAGHSLRVYTLTELARMLNHASFTVVATYGGTDGGPLTMDSLRMIVLARKL